MGKGFNFRAVLGAYMATGIVVALAIHFIAQSSPRYRGLSPPPAASSVAPVSSASGVK